MPHRRARPSLPSVPQTAPSKSGRRRRAGTGGSSNWNGPVAGKRSGLHHHSRNAKSQFQWPFGRGADTAVIQRGSRSTILALCWGTTPFLPGGVEVMRHWGWPSANRGSWRTQVLEFALPKLGMSRRWQNCAWGVAQRQPEPWEMVHIKPKPRVHGALPHERRRPVRARRRRRRRRRRCRKHPR